jgi:PAS domain S-box-containing protein
LGSAVGNAPVRAALDGAATVAGGVGLLTILFGMRALDREARDRARVDGELRASEEKYSRILAIAADAIITVDDQQRILHFNRRAEELFGWPESEILGQELQILIPERFRDQPGEHISHLRDAADVSRRLGPDHGILGVRRDGSEFPAEASISRVELGERRLFTVLLRDVTNQTREKGDERFLARAGAALGASLDYESTLVSVAHLAIPYLADCCVLDVGESEETLRRVVSVHDDPDITKRLRTLESARVDDALWPFPVAESIRRNETVVQDPLPASWSSDGAAPGSREQLVSSLGIRALMTVPLVARERTVGALTLLATDPARHYGPEQGALAESLVQSAAFAIDNAWLYQVSRRATQARDEILGVVSHDLRNPLSAIGMCARVLLTTTSADPEAWRKLSATILESTALMDRLIQDLLDVAMIESGHLTIDRRQENVRAIVGRVLAMIEQPALTRDITVRVEVPRTLPEVNVDAARIMQVLANLLGNAVKFTEGGGTIVVEARESAEGVEVVVTDTGAGIPAEHIPHIFDRYWHARRSAQTAGTGLGLAIACGIVEAHGGRIWVHSVVGKGSDFHFTLPLTAST